MSKSTEIPDSAISSWGGFVYQGKVALYHAVTLLLDGHFGAQSVSDFQLQLDSTDDFAIYVNGDAISVHQVKAKNAKYRSAFNTALKKSSKICTDCTPETSRFFHIAQCIDDDSDYTNETGGKVVFYEYEGKRFCPISAIESLTKEKIAAYLKKSALPSTDILVDKKYCHLSEMISTHVIKIHAVIHDENQTQNDAAYFNVIASTAIKSILYKNYNENEDEEYTLLKLRATFANTFEAYIIDEDCNFCAEEVKRAELAFNFIYTLDDTKLLNVLASLRPHSPTDPLRIDDIQNYADIIMTVAREMVLVDVPHYGKNQLKYLPTAIHLEQRRASYFKKQLSRQILESPQLINLLFEFDTFIAMGDVTDLVVEEQTEKVTTISDTTMQSKPNIVKMISLRIVSRDVAQEELK